MSESQLFFFYFIFKFLFIFKSFISIQLIYNVVLVSGIQQSESVIHIHVLNSSIMSNSFSVPWIGRLLCSWDSPGKNTGVGCHFLLKGIFPTQELNPYLLCLLHWQVDSLPTEPPGKQLFSTTDLFNNLFILVWAHIYLIYTLGYSLVLGFPGGASGKEPAC